MLSPGADQGPMSKNSVELFIVETNYQSRNLFQRCYSTYPLMETFGTIYTLNSCLLVPKPFALAKTYAYFNATSYFSFLWMN